MWTTSYLINDRIAVDAGALAHVLSIEEQAAISHIFFSHSHIDHLAGLPFILDNVFSLIEKPVAVFGPRDTIRCLREHLFNDFLWPDFSKFSNSRTAILEMAVVDAGERVPIDGVEIVPFPMDHSVECHGYLIEGRRSAIAICGDTCSLDGLLRLRDGVDNLKAVFVEASFPADQAKIAKISKHLATDSFGETVEKHLSDVDVYATHLKPEYLKKISGEIEALGLDNVALLEQGKEYIF